MQRIQVSAIALLLLLMPGCDSTEAILLDDPIAHLPLGLAYDSLHHHMRSILGAHLVEESPSAVELGTTRRSDTHSRYDSTTLSSRSGSVDVITYAGGVYHNRPVEVWQFTFIDSHLASVSLSLRSDGEANTADVVVELADKLRRLHPPVTGAIDSTSPTSSRASVIDNFIHDNVIYDDVGIGAGTDPRGSQIWHTSVNGVIAQVAVQLRRDSTIWIRYGDPDHIVKRFGHMRRIFTLPE